MFKTDLKVSYFCKKGQSIINVNLLSLHFLYITLIVTENLNLLDKITSKKVMYF